jgi:hypothetical protein
VSLSASAAPFFHDRRVELAEGRLSIPMKVTEFPASPELVVAAQLALTERSAKAYDNDGALRVRMLSSETS